MRGLAIAVGVLLLLPGLCSLVLSLSILGDRSGYLWGFILFFFWIPGMLSGLVGIALVAARALANKQKKKAGLSAVPHETPGPLYVVCLGMIVVALAPWLVAGAGVPYVYFLFAGLTLAGLLLSISGLRRMYIQMTANSEDSQTAE